MINTTTRTTWEQLAALDPRLATLAAEAAAVHDDGRPEGFCAHAYWYGRFKPRLLALVGWEASSRAQPALRAMDAYDVAYEHVYGLLPDCRHDSMCWHVENEGIER